MLDDFRRRDNLFFGKLTILIWLGRQNRFHVMRGDFWKNCFFEKNFFELFHLLLDFGREKFGLSAKVFRQDLQICIQCVQRRFLIVLFFLRKVIKFFPVFGLWGRYSGGLAQKLEKDCQNFFLRVRKRFFGETLTFGGKKFLYYFRVLIKNFADFCRKEARQVSKDAFQSFPENFFGKVIFLLGKKSCLSTEVEVEGFWNSVKSFDRFVQTAFCVSERDFWVNCSFFALFEFLHCFKAVERTFCNIGGKNSETMPKQFSTSTTNLLEENLFSEENTYFYNFFEFWSKNSRTFVKKHSTRFQKLLSTIVQGNFLQNIIFFRENKYAYYRTLKENIWISLNFFWYCGQNCILCVQQIFLRNFFLFHKVFKFFSCVQSLSRKFWSFRGSNLVGLSKPFSSVHVRF